MISYSDTFASDGERLDYLNKADKETIEKTRLKALLGFLRKLTKPLNKKLEKISALIAGIMSVPIFLDVSARMILGKSIPGIIEAEEFMMILIVFLALSFLQTDKEHISIDLLHSKLPKRIRLFMDIFNYAVCFVVFSLMGWQTVLQVGQKVGEVSFLLGIPISLFLAVAAFGTLLLALVLLTDLLESMNMLWEKGGLPWIISALVMALFVLALPFLIKMLPGRFTGLPLGLTGMCALFILLLIKMPIGFAMSVTGFLGMLIISKNMTAPLSMLGIAPYHATASFILAVVPLFVLMGELSFYSGISRDLFDSAYKWLGRLPGGLAMSAVAGCAGFAAVCGDSMSTAVTMGAVSLPEMEKKNYSPSLATGSLAAGGTLGILIPPSVGFIFYAIVTEESVGKLFIAGILPGLLLAGLFMLCIYFMAKYKPELAPRGESASLKEKIVSLKGVIPMLLLFLLVLGGILGGIFSPTEGGGIGAVGAFVYALCRKRISRENLMQAMRETAKLTTKLLMILIGVTILGYFLAATRLPFILADTVTGLEVGRYSIYAAILFLFIILGCLMNVIPMILLTLPAIYPSIVALGFDPIWFGVITVIVMEMG
ncbi:MAG: TRAP transporter large permease subunit, partial [Deltaproteobacteria bacterium]|nr:TRAP transporter large permease subunit [Deltaproteobacteria bacterium]